MGGVHCTYTVAYMNMRRPGGEGGAHYVRMAEGGREGEWGYVYYVREWKGEELVHYLRRKEEGVRIT